MPKKDTYRRFEIHSSGRRPLVSGSYCQNLVLSPVSTSAGFQQLPAIPSAAPAAVRQSDGSVRCVSEPHQPRSAPDTERWWCYLFLPISRPIHRRRPGGWIRTDPGRRGGSLFRRGGAGEGREGTHQPTRGRLISPRLRSGDRRRERNRWGKHIHMCIPDIPVCRDFAKLQIWLRER